MAALHLQSPPATDDNAIWCIMIRPDTADKGGSQPTAQHNHMTAALYSILEPEIKGVLGG